MTVSACPVDCGCLCHLLDTHYCCLSLNGSFNPPSASHPPTPTTPHPPTPPPTHPTTPPPHQPPHHPPTPPPPHPTTPPSPHPTISPPHHPHHFPTPATHPLIRAICDITVTVKKVAQKPAVLAS